MTLRFRCALWISCRTVSAVDRGETLDECAAAWRAAEKQLREVAPDWPTLPFDDVDADAIAAAVNRRFAAEAHILRLLLDADRIGPMPRGQWGPSGSYGG
jgi:hypothetical protein